MMVTIAVLIVLIAATATYSLLSPALGRDAEREADIEGLASLIELHYETTGRYPFLSELTGGGVRNVTNELLSPPEAPVSVVNTASPTIMQYGYVTFTHTGTVCTGGGTCGKRFALYWRSERTGTVHEKRSVN